MARTAAGGPSSSGSPYWQHAPRPGPVAVKSRGDACVGRKCDAAHLLLGPSRMSPCLHPSLIHSSFQPPYLQPPWGCLLLLLLHCLHHALLRVEHRVRLVPLLVRDGLRGRGKVRTAWRGGRLLPFSMCGHPAGSSTAQGHGQGGAGVGFILIKRGQPHLPFRQQGRRPFSSRLPPQGAQAGRWRCNITAL